MYKLISNLIIDNQKYYSSSGARTIDEQKIYENNYEYSDIRNWLNNDFLNKAFSTTLQSYINTTRVDNSLLSTGDKSNPYVCNNTSDKIYLPSYSEITNTMYGYMRYERFDQAKAKKLTDYAKAKGCSIFFDSSCPEYYNNGSYWLRSPYFNFGGCARYVGIIGDVDSNTGFVSGNSIGVAPALTITIKKVL